MLYYSKLFKKSVIVIIRVFSRKSSSNKSLSPVIKKFAFESLANESKKLYLTSLHASTFEVTLKKLA